MLQIDPMQFLLQAGALCIWVFIAAGVYAAFEKLFETDRDRQ